MTEADEVAGAKSLAATEAARAILEPLTLVQRLSVLTLLVAVELDAARMSPDYFALRVKLMQARLAELIKAELAKSKN